MSSGYLSCGMLICTLGVAVVSTPQEKGVLMFGRRAFLQMRVDSLFLNDPNPIFTLGLFVIIHLSRQ